MSEKNSQDTQYRIQGIVPESLVDSPLYAAVEEELVAGSFFLRSKT